MSDGTISRGDTVDANQLWQVLERSVARLGAGAQPITFVLGEGRAVERVAAEAWVAESEALGFTQVRYVVLPQAEGGTLVELAAIKPLDARLSGDPLAT